jgi:predicted GIY-YIG superfamily endonuclease
MGDAFMDWFVYIVECRDGSLYTGITNDLQKRIESHNAGTWCQYTRRREDRYGWYTAKMPPADQPPANVKSPSNG